MNFFKYSFQLILIISLCQYTIKSSYIKIPYAKEDIPISKDHENFHPFDIALEFIEYQRNKKYIANKILKFKNIIKKIPNIISQLFLSNSKLEINYNEKLLNQLYIPLNPYQNNNFKEKKIITDLLIIIKFKSMQDKGMVTSNFYEGDGTSAKYTKGHRIYISVFNINYIYDLDNEYDEEIFLMNLIKNVFKSIGFRYQFLAKNFIKNKFDNVPLYLVENSEIYKTYKKLMEFNDIKINSSNQSSTLFYNNFWEINNLKFHDIMNQEYSTDYVISELTMKVFNEIQYITLPKCDLFKFEQGVNNNFKCLRVTQDCLDGKIKNEYFVEYGIDKEKDGQVKCYLNTKENIKNEQCGIKYGNLLYNDFNLYFTPAFKQIKDTSFLTKRNIPELNLYKNQTIKLLKNPPSCKIGTPRTVFFKVPPDIFDEEKNNTNITSLIQELKEINKDVEYEQITLGETDKKYFVTYETYEDNYNKDCVMKVMNYSGIIRSFANLHSHNLLIKNPQPIKLEQMGIIPSFQKMFSHNNFEMFAYKDQTYIFYYMMRQEFPEDYDYMPETYSYPENATEVIKKFRKYKLSEDDLWLIKPKKSSLGKGIKIFRKLEQAPSDFIITKYISYPHLIHKHKYDFRIYILVTGIYPFKIYLYQEGLVRFTTEKYSLDFNKLDELYRHLTNVGMNVKNTKSYKKAVNADTTEGSRWSLKVYKEYCEQNGINFKKIWEQFADIAIKSLFAVRDLFLITLKYNGTKDKNHFKLLGYDFLLDENFKVHLLEVNSRPSLLMKDINDLKLKPQLIADTLNIVGITPYSHDYKDNFQAYDYNGYDINEEDLDDNEDGVNRALCEFGRPRGRFELIFPLKNKVNYYKKFYKGDLIADEMLWEKL